MDTPKLRRLETEYFQLVYDKDFKDDRIQKIRDLDQKIKARYSEFLKSAKITENHAEGSELLKLYERLSLLSDTTCELYPKKLEISLYSRLQTKELRLSSAVIHPIGFAVK